MFNNGFKIGDYVTLKGKSFKPGRIIDIVNWRATVGWRVKYRNQHLLTTKTISVYSLELYIPKKKDGIIRRIFKKITPSS